MALQVFEVDGIGKSCGKNAIPLAGRNRIFAVFGATLFVKHFSIFEGICF